ncbi:MAG: carboxymuconolactone decarboxylase family protein [Planctomycetota bacterium]|nr:carboxymuconolactone decarboxylase family protein [Planctomycetota bacterium]
MPRLHVIDPTTESGPGVDLLNGPLKSKQINIFKGIANNANVLEALLGFGQGIKNVLSAAEHEVIALVCAEKRHCEYCTAAHTMVAKSLGIDDEASSNIRQGNVADEKQQALIDFTSLIIETNGFVTDEQFDSFKAAGFDDAAIVEVVAGIANNTFTNLFNHVNDTEIDFPIPAQV